MSRSIGEQPRRVLIVEDEGMSRAFLLGLLTDAGYEVQIHETAADAASAFTSFAPSALITDIDLGDGPTGLDLLIALRKRSPTLAIIVLSNYVIPRDRRSSALAGAAYLRKSDIQDPSEIIGTLERLLDPLEVHPPPGRVEGVLAALTEPQLQVLRFMAMGLNNEEIASRRGTSTKSVEHMVHRIFAALGLHDVRTINPRVAAARIYISEAGMPRRP